MDMLVLPLSEPLPVHGVCTIRVSPNIKPVASVPEANPIPPLFAVTVAAKLNTKRIFADRR